MRRSRRISEERSVREIAAWGEMLRQAAVLTTVRCASASACIPCGIDPFNVFCYVSYYSARCPLLLLAISSPWTPPQIKITRLGALIVLSLYRPEAHLFSLVALTDSP